MKAIIVLVLMVSNVYATGGISCRSDDGSVAHIVMGKGDKPTPIQASYSIRGSEVKEASVSLLSTSPQGEYDRRIDTLILSDSETGEIATVVTGNTLIDRTGNYEVECELDY